MHRSYNPRQNATPKSDTDMAGFFRAAANDEDDGDHRRMLPQMPLFDTQEAMKGDVVSINISGKRFMVRESVLQRVPSRLSHLSPIDVHYSAESQEYFFSRNAPIFECECVCPRTKDFFYLKHFTQLFWIYWSRANYI